MFGIKVGDRVVICNNSLLPINEDDTEVKWIIGTVQDVSIEHLEEYDWDEHYEGTKLYTVLGDDGNIHKGFSYTSQPYTTDCYVHSINNFIEHYASKLEKLRQERISLTNQIANIDEQQEKILNLLFAFEEYEKTEDKDNKKLTRSKRE